MHPQKELYQKKAYRDYKEKECILIYILYLLKV